MADSSYVYKPNIFSSSGRSFRLEPDAVVGEWGGTTRRLAYADIVSMRFSTMKPPMQPLIASCFIGTRDGAKMTLRSLSAKGFRPEDRTATYTPFVAGLIERVRQANPNVVTEVGQSRALWIFNIVVLISCVVVVIAAVIALASGLHAPSNIPILILMIVYMPSLWRSVRGGPPKPFDPRGLAPGVVPSETM